MSKPLNIRFWTLLHDVAERIWHWIWRVKLLPYHAAVWANEEKRNEVYTKIVETDEVTIYRAGGYWRRKRLE